MKVSEKKLEIDVGFPTWGEYTLSLIGYQLGPMAMYLQCSPNN